MIFFLYNMPNGLPYHRFAVTTKKKIGNAVERNYIRRKMKELFRVKQGLLKQEHDLWVVMKQKFTWNDREMIDDLFTQALIKIDKKWSSGS